MSTVLGLMWKLLFSMYDQGVIQISKSLYAAELESLLVFLAKYKPEEQLNPVREVLYYVIMIGEGG